MWVEQWPLNSEKLSALYQLVEREVQAGHLEPSISPWNAPVFVIQKKDTTKWRLLHDLRAVNQQMQAMGALQHGLPWGSAIVKDWPIVIVDIKDCFFSIPLHPTDRDLPLPCRL